MPSRRDFLAGALATVAVACTGGGGGGKTLRELSKEGPTISLLGLGAGAGGGEPEDPLQVGKTDLAFDLAFSGSLVGGGTPQVYLARTDDSPLLGPYRATWTPFTGYAKTGDHSPKSQIPGVYWARVRFPRSGLWTVAAVHPEGALKGIGFAQVYAGEPKLAKVGSRAIAVETPVATTERGLKEICTRTPPDPMHSASLRDVLRNGKPTVAVFSTPALCESELCGPVTDEVLLVAQAYGPARANFIHVEEFLPGPDLKPDASKLSPGFRAWGFTTEPWVIVIDRRGIIRARMEGPATAPMIEAALRALL